LLIEISDTTLKNNLETKQKIYAFAGIQEYWVVDIQGSQIKVFRQPEGNRYLKEFNFSQGEIVPMAFPDVAIESERILSY
jgi:Uma2 family endonuclease